MKQKILFTGMVLAIFGLYSCSDNEPESKNPVKLGTEIRFGAILDENGIQSRTVYGEEETDADGNFYWPIYWNYPDNLDQIFIYSPQGVSGRNQATYTVNPESAGQNTAAQINKVGAFGIQAGTGSSYDFYGMYPASAILTNTPATGTSISATLPHNQAVTFAGTTTVPSTVVPSVPEVNAHYVMSPDMASCLMIAENTGVTLVEGESVNLLFTPFSSVLDITIPGTQETNTITGADRCAVTSVRITADAPISGDFTYNFFDQSLTFGKEGADTIWVSTLGPDADGNLVGVPLTNDNTLRLQAFLLPNPAVTDVKVTVYTSDSQIWTKTLTMTNGSGTSIFKPRQIHKVTLPKLKLDEADFDYSMWLAQLDPRIYLSEISLPGSTSSFSGYYQQTMQTLTIQQQLDAGIRVFRCSINMYDNATGTEPGVPALDPDLNVHFGINVNGGNEIMRLTTAVRTLAQEMQNKHPNEFCVLMVSDYGSGINYQTFYQNFAKITKRMQELGYTPNEVNSHTTIGDVKGKVILKLQLNGDGGASNGGTSSANATNTYLQKIQTWSAVNGAEALFNWWTSRNGSTLFYAPMVYRNVGEFSYTGSFTAVGGTPTITEISSGLVCDAANRLVSNYRYVFPGYGSNLNTVAVPTEAQGWYDPNKWWYIYGAQAQPSNSNQYNESYGLIEQAVNAIKTQYRPDGLTTHNKIFMVYLGGASTSYDQATVTERFVPQWNILTDAADYGVNRPFGWVLFNHIPDPTLSDESLGAADKLVRDGIRKVISRNNDLNFKLLRKKSETSVSKVAPSGDVTGTPSGGALF